jgi:hypothetical protein
MEKIDVFCYNSNIRVLADAIFTQILKSKERSEEHD